MLGRLGAAGRGAPGVMLGLTIAPGTLGASPMPLGIGCLGPDKIWPGLGYGTGLEGIAEPLVTGACVAGLGTAGPGAG
jgi:hypothetical protein